MQVSNDDQNVADLSISASKKYLSFFLGNEEYAFDILKVQEIIGLMPITAIPKMPDYIRGVLNLRGKIVPVMDLRLRFGLPAAENTNETCVIVVQDTKYLMGVLVDKVSEVVDISETEIEEVPTYGIESFSDYLTGIGKNTNSVKMIVDVHKVVFNVAEDVKNPPGLKNSDLKKAEDTEKFA